MKHYEFTEETIEHFGITLKRIVCTVSFKGVKVGDLGGFIEKEKNLSGDAWVYGNAWVYGDARVSGDAWVSGNARVSGDAWDKSPLYIQGSRYSVNMCDKKTLVIGCQKHTLDEWGEIYQEIAEEHDAEDIIEEYRLYYELACKLYKEEL